MINKLDIKLLNKYHDEGSLIKEIHKSKPLIIWNYSKKVQYERCWNEILLQCRGLITDFEGNIIARPFKKFFNLEEHNKSDILNDLSYEVFEKMDGSLGILFHYEGDWIFASRGSFTSDQAVWGTNKLKEWFGDDLSLNWMGKDDTFIFEIIYPENRIVCNYGDDEDLVLLSVIDTETGEELSYEDITEIYRKYFRIVKRYDGFSTLDVTELRDFEEDNREGFVVRYSNGFRVKVKFKEYCRLHRIITNVSTKSIWEALKNGDGLEGIIDSVPDEFFNWVKETKRDLLQEYDTIERDALKEFWRIYIVENKTLKKDFTLVAKDYKYSGILFKLYDGTDKNGDPVDYSNYIWKLIKPVYPKPFMDGGDDDNVERIEI